MKILSYNIYGVKETNSPIPIWETRQENIKRILDTLLKDDEIKVCCFQEVNENNMNALNEILENNNFKMLDTFPMKTESINQYNIIAIKNDSNIKKATTVDTKSESAFKVSNVNINTATQTELETLPGIGPSLALKIINYRKENGKFKSIEELKSVNGIGENKYEEIKKYIYV